MSTSAIWSRIIADPPWRPFTGCGDAGHRKAAQHSELVDWLRALAAGGVAPERIAREIPFAGVLVKKDKDLRTLRKALG